MRWAATILMLVAVEAGAQVAGRVVDAETEKPVEGAVAVAYSRVGDAMHLAEATADAKGRIEFTRWSPAAREGGRREEDSSRVLVFKSGYEPLVTQKYQSGETLRLTRTNAPTADYVKSLINFEERDLHWRYTPDSPAFPKMILALHREKARLGEDGLLIPGANAMQGRSGTGQLVDAADGKHLDVNGVVRITWTLRRSDGAPGSRLLLQTKNSSSFQRAGEFFVSPWRLPSPAPEGWDIDPAVRPVVRAYVQGYAPSDEVKWAEAGGTIALRKRPEGREAYLTAIREIRSEVDSALAKGDRDEVMKQYRFLLYQQRYLCDAITPDLRQGACYDESSDAYRYVAEARRVEKYAPETSEGSIRIVTESSSSSQAKAVPVTAASTPAGPPPTKNVGGFSIETK